MFETIEVVMNVILELVEITAGFNSKGIPGVFAVRTIWSVPEIVAVTPVITGPDDTIIPIRLVAISVAVSEPVDE